MRSSGLVKIAPEAYTRDVKVEKSIHILLILALCYGQFVANVHLVGHLHAHESEVSGHFTLHVCHSGVPNPVLSSTFRSPLPAGHHNCQSLVEAENHAENDCAIYHVLSSLSGITCANHKELVTQSGLVDTASLRVIDLPNVVLANQRIRAPPVHS